MELKVFRDTLPQAGANCTLKAELPLETEVLISDYLPPIFKLVKCFAKPIVLQKRLQPGKLLLDGYLRCTLFYQGEDGIGLCQTEQKLPFTKQLELPEFPFTAWTATVESQTEYLNSRVVNPRRIEVRGAVSLLVGVRTQDKTEIITALADGGIEQKLQTLSGSRSTAVLDKLVTLEGELNFPQTPEAVLDITGIAEVKELKLLSGKAVVKGSLQVQCAWRAQGDPGLQNQTAALSLNQVVDLNGITEDSQCFCVAEPIGFTLSQGENASAQTLSANVMLHLRAWRPYQLQYVADAFSTRFETALSMRETATEKLIGTIREQITSTGSGPLPDVGAQLRACFVSYGPLQVTQKGDAFFLNCRAVTTALVENSLAELESYEKSIELSLPLAMQTPPGGVLYPECWISTEDVRCSCTGGTLEVTVTAAVEGAILCSSKVQSLEAIELGEVLGAASSDIALRIYYAQAGEELFSIAKRFHVSPARMLAANDLAPELVTLPQAEHLLVPGN